MQVTVIPRFRFPAWKGQLPVDTPFGDVVDLLSALERDYAGADACILQYAPHPDDEVSEFPRLSKAALGYWQTQAQDDPEPQMTVALVDVDTVGHVVPEDGWAESVVANVPADLPCGWYRTPHGLRLLFVPQTPVSISYADSYLEQLHQKLQAAGVPTDYGTRDWTRLFFAPKAMGRDLPSDYTNLRALDWHPATLDKADPQALGPIIERSIVDATQLAPLKLTRSYLRPLGTKSKLADQLLAKTFAAPEGQRHSTMLAAVWEIVLKYDTIDPAVPFGVLLDSCQSMGKDAEELYRICTWVCAMHSGAKAESEAEREAVLDELATIMDVHTEEAQQYTIVDAGPEFFVWDEERREYSTGYIRQHQLLGALSRHAPSISQPHASASVEEIMRDLSVVADKVVYSYNEPTARYDRKSYKFMIPAGKRDRQLRPRYRADVAEWLQALFGPHADNIDRGLSWMAAVPMLDRPVCALYVHGDPSIGKGMLALGIARLWSEEMQTTNYKVLSKDFNHELIEAPLIYADESVHQARGVENDSSVFRQIVGNTALPINIKFRAPATLLGYPRLLITANNADALNIREELDASDIEAIQLRVGYIRASADAIDVLHRLAADGGYESAADMTKGWVQGGAIAEHMLWLSENYTFKPGHRMLVEGWESEFTRSLATAAGSSGALAETIALAIVHNPVGLNDAVRWFGGTVYCNANLIAKAWPSITGIKNDRPPTSNRLVKALKGLAGDGRRVLDVASGAQRRQLNYWCIPAAIIADYADTRNVAERAAVMQACNRESEDVKFDFSKEAAKNILAKRSSDVHSGETSEPKEPK
jgi:hypothetical protein